MTSKQNRRLVVRVSYKAVIQYLLIYFMMLMNQSVIRDSFFLNNYIVFVFILIPAIKYGFYKNKYVMSFLIPSLLICTLKRLFVGGVGLGIWVSWASFILVTYSAIKADVNNFPDRLVKLVVFFATVSLLLWGLSLVNITLVQKLMLFRYKMRTNFAKNYIDSVRYTKVYYDAYGGLLYCVNMCHPKRNCGIFTEPGVYQMVLNSALFVLLFLKERIVLSEKKRYRYTILLILTVISTQSTTGILALAMLLLFSLNIKLSRFQARVLSFISGLAVLLVFQFLLQGKNSLLYKTVIGKLFTSSGQFSLAATTGSARLGTILVCSMSMLRNPFGVGYDKVMELLNSDITGYVAASIFTTGAACGVGMLFLIIAWIVTPFLKSNWVTRYGKISFILVYFNTILAQSSEFYPFLIFVPILLMTDLSKHKSRRIYEFVKR